MNLGMRLASLIVVAAAGIVVNHCAGQSGDTSCTTGCHDQWTGMYDNYLGFESCKKYTWPGFCL